MLQIDNETPFSAAIAVFPDLAGVESAYLAIKGTFLMGTENPQLATQQVALNASDVFWGNPVSSSLRIAGDYGLPKPSTDVLLCGRAIAPSPGTRVADVSLRVGNIERCLRVLGDRRWQRSGGRWKPSDPERWERMPLRWELAFGGIAGAKNDALPEYEARNPVGRGFVACDTSPEQGQVLPNIEDPQALIVEPHDRPTPACFAPIAPTWQPRRRYAGTYDDPWLRNRAPYLPVDFDQRFFHVAPTELIAPEWLTGGESVVLQGFSLGGPLHFELPRCGLDVEFEFDGGTLPKPALLETVMFEPDAGRFQMLWRAGLAVDKRLLRLSSATIRSSAFEADSARDKPLSRLGGLPAAYSEKTA